MTVINTNTIPIGSSAGVVDSLTGTFQNPTWWWVAGIVVAMVLVLVFVGVLH
jgi:hypothetical protein